MEATKILAAVPPSLDNALFTTNRRIKNGDMETEKTRRWWQLLCAIAVTNCLLLAWTYSAVHSVEPRVSWQLRLCTVYVLVCAFRSVVPRVDLERSCLFDNPLSSMVLGRSAATIAELCFAAQCALFLNQAGQQAGLGAVVACSYAVVPLLFTAQLFCWHSVCTLSHLGHALENSLWAGTMGMIGLCLGASAWHLTGQMQVCAVLGFLFALAFVGFMVSVDVPMYIKRWRQGRADGETYLSISEGFMDALKRRHATWDWTVWKPEVAWMTGYFSAAV